MYLDEGDMCVITKDAATGAVSFVCEPLLIAPDSLPVAKGFTVHHLDLTLDAIEKGGFKHCTSVPYPHGTRTLTLASLQLSLRRSCRTACPIFLCPRIWGCSSALLPL